MFVICGVLGGKSHFHSFFQNGSDDPERERSNNCARASLQSRYHLREPLANRASSLRSFFLIVVGSFAKEKKNNKDTLDKQAIHSDDKETK